MKAKVILYGWVISWIFLFAGIGTIENDRELTGALLCTVWFVFSLLLIGNEKECAMLWLMGGSDKDNNQGLGFN